MSESNVNTPPASAASANGLGYGPIKPLAVRLNESTRTQLDIIAQLNDRTVTDEVRLAIEAWIDKTKVDPAIQRRAKDVRDEIEREAAGKRDAIAAGVRGAGAPPRPAARSARGFRIRGDGSIRRDIRSVREKVVVRRASVSAVAAVAVMTALAGCAASTDTVPPTQVSPSVAPSNDDRLQQLAPTIVSPGELDGVDVSVVIGTALVVAVEDGTEDQWRGATGDVTIAEFSAGGSNEGATFRPGFQARALGSTGATLTAPDGRQIDFTISVVAP